MRYSTIILLFIQSVGYGQVTMEVARDSIQKYHLGQYSYLEEFIGHHGYGAPIILTADGGAAAFGDGDDGSTLIKLDNSGREQWKAVLPPKGSEMESQSVVQDKSGNYYVFILVYDNAKYRGGCERAALVNSKGTLVWDKFIGSCNLVNSPTVSYIRSLQDGRIALRGHVVKQTPPKGKDPTYLFWEGWLTSKGVLTQKSGAVIDWKKTEEWKSRLKPE
jgi:hypothetical protein